MTRRPTAFDIDEVEFDPTEPAVAPETAPEAPPASRRGFRWFQLFAAGLLSISFLALSLSLTAFIEDLFARTPLLGTLALVLAALMILGLLGMALKEWVALRRLSEVEDLRRRAEKAGAADDRRAALAIIKDLDALYGDRPGTAAGRAALKAHAREIIDGRDLMALAERELLAPLDKEVRTLIVASSRRVAVVTALSPRALVDVVYVTFEAVALVRRIAFVYGGRPGTLGFLRVLRQAVGHLAVTGGMAVTDDLVANLLGKTMATFLFRSVGEGIVNGLMTARLGLAAMDVLRPLPFKARPRPGIKDIATEISKILPKDGAAP